MNISKSLIIILSLASSILAGCSQKSSDGDGSVKYNSVYLDTTSKIQSNFSISTSIYQQIDQDYSARIEQGVLEHKGIRPTTVHFGTLDTNVLGLTQCNYYSDGSSNCDVTLSDVINPDTAPDSGTRYQREIALGGVLRHELGHAFGMGHIKNNPDHVMYPYFMQVQTDEVNVEQFITDLNNFRYNGSASGLPDMSTK